MPPSKTGPSEKKQGGNPLRDLFEGGGVIPISPLHQIFQEAALQAGWSPPWKQLNLTNAKKEAGKRSGENRDGRRHIRRSLVMVARKRLKPDLRRTPYSNDALEALRVEYKLLLNKGADDPDPIISGIHLALSDTDRKLLKKASDDTLKKDLQAIRRMSGIKREDPDTP